MRRVSCHVWNAIRRRSAWHSTLAFYWFFLYAQPMRFTKLFQQHSGVWTAEKKWKVKYEWWFNNHTSSLTISIWLRTMQLVLSLTYRATRRWFLQEWRIESLTRTVISINSNSSQTGLHYLKVAQGLLRNNEIHPKFCCFCHRQSFCR